MRYSVFILVPLLSLENQAEAMLITGGTDQREHLTQGAQAGVAAAFNVSARVAWWEGPPFGGGQYHAECRGDADAFNAVLKDFAKIDAKDKKVVVRDGVGSSFWLNANGDPAKAKEAEIDWTLMAWRIDSWKRIQGMPPGLRPPDVDPEAADPPIRLNVYVGGNINWDGVIVPEEVTIDDQRLEANGLSPSDGRVFTGLVTMDKAEQPADATVALQSRTTTKDGKAEWTTVKDVPVDQYGKWMITNVATGSYRLVAAAPGYASRIVAYVTSKGDPGWSTHTTTLAKQASISGRVVDEAGQPLSDAEVVLRNVSNDDGENYRTLLASRHPVSTDGTFRIEGLPTGWANVSAFCEGYCKRGLGEDVILPSAGVSVSLVRAGQLDVEVSFPNGRPKGRYLIDVKEAGGEKVGSWGGSGNIDKEDRLVWKNIPPGKYVLFGRPNPGSTKEETEPQVINIVGGETTYVTVTAK